MQVGILGYLYFFSTTTYYAKDGSFYLTVPSRYQLKEVINSKDSLVLDLYREKHNWLLYVSALSLDRQVDLTTLASKDQNSLEAYLGSISNLSEITPFPVSNGEAVCYSYQYTSTVLNKELAATTVMIKTPSNKLYVATASVSLEQKEKDLNTLLTMLQTFQETIS